MRTATFPVPMMYGDHHVSAVRQLLLSLPGITEVYASSSFQVVEVVFNESEITQEQVEKALEDSGYLEELAFPTEIGSDSAAGKPYFRHTAVFAQTGQAVSFTQIVPAAARPLWPCPGIKTVIPND